MKSALIVISLFTCIHAPAVAFAETVSGQAYTAAFPHCSPNAIPEAVQASIDSALDEAQQNCEKITVSNVRILSLEPVGCKGWSAGYQPKVEIDFVCSR